MTSRTDRIMALAQQQLQDDTEVVSNDEPSESIGLDNVNSNEFVINVNSDLSERQDEIIILNLSNIEELVYDESDNRPNVNSECVEFLISQDDVVVEIVNDVNLTNESPPKSLENEPHEDDNDPDYNPSIDAADVFDSDASEDPIELREETLESVEAIEGVAAENNSSGEGGAQNNKRKRRKRNEVDERQWAVNKNKKLREIGRAYCGKKRINGKWDYSIKKEGRKMKERCGCKCKDNSKIRCSSIKEEERKTIFEKFWKLNRGEKKVYVDLLVLKLPTARSRDRKTEEVSRREFSYIYFLENNLKEKVRVCKKMFQNTIDLGEKTIRLWKNSNSEDAEDSNEDTDENAITNRVESGIKYQKVSEARRKISNESNVALNNFFDSLPKMESHYCRASTDKLYLEPNWTSKQALYKEYCKWTHEKNVKPLSSTVFANVFSKKNLSLFRPKKDECDICVAYRTGNISQEMYNLHQEKKNEARAEKEADKENEEHVFTMDLQSVLLCPKSQVSSLYYKTKLAVHNLTFFNLKSKDVTCYVWHEAEGGLTANEFTSIICDVITNLGLLPPQSKVILYSDGCCYQNRNAVLSNALFNLAKLKDIIIVQKYLEKGHTQMEADSVHSAIERQVRGRVFNVPADYVTAMKKARSNPKPYNIKYLDHLFFRNYESLNFFKSIRPGKKSGDPCVVDIRALKYTDKEILYKLRFSDGWKKLPLRIPSTVQTSHDIPILYKERLPIKSSKYQDLQALKLSLPLDYHSFYDNLPHRP